MSVSETLSVVSGLPGFRELGPLMVRELRVELADVKRLRAVLDGRLVDIVRRIEESTREVGTHERGIPEVELIAHGGMTKREANDVLKRVLVIEEAPEVGDALAAGDLSAGHVDAISRAMKIAGDAKDAFMELVPDLVEAASVMSVPEFTVEVTKAAKGVVTDGGLSTFEDQRRSTYLKIWNDATGMVNVRGMFDPEIGAILQSRVNSQVETMFHSGDRDVPVVHHTHVDANDFRRAHALVALIADDHEDCTRPGGRGVAGRSETVGHVDCAVRDGMSAGRGASRTATSRPGGSCRSDVVVHVDLETLTNGLSASSTHRTAFGADLPVETIRRIACDANIIPLVLNGAGMPLDIGRGQRLASAAQRRALEATHDTCAFDGCAVAFHACQIHHIEYWEHGGPTDLDNMVPLCSRHHHAAHEGGWTLKIKPGSRQLDARPPNRVLTS
jgi:hypothetical protein